jgi:hypothetical protein
MGATISFTIVVNNPEKIPPRPGTKLRITLSQFFRRLPPLGIPDLRNAISFPPIPFTGSANIQIGVGDTSVQYWIDVELLPGNGGSDFVGSWNDTFDLFVVNPGSFSVTDGELTNVTMVGSLIVHQHL